MARQTVPECGIALLFAACASFVALASSAHCQSISQRLVGGYSVSDADQEALGLVQVESPRGNCSGTLLSQFVVLTAHHCVDLTDGDTRTIDPKLVTISAAWTTKTVAPTLIYSWQGSDGLDVAILALERGDFGPRLRQRLDTRSVLPNDRLIAFGRGMSSFAKYDDRGIAQPAIRGTQYQSADFFVEPGAPNTSVFSYGKQYWFKPNSSMAIVAKGDSGGPSYSWQPMGLLGTGSIIGVHSRCKSVCMDGKVCPDSDPTWVTGVEYCIDADLTSYESRHALNEIESVVDSTNASVAKAWPSFGSKRLLGTVYTIDQNADLLLRNYFEEDWGGNLRPSFSQPVQVGNGWGGFDDVVGGGGEVVYARTKITGQLLWYRHTGQTQGKPNWTGPNTVGAGFADFVRVVSAGDGVLYGLSKDGTLYWYKHNTFLEGTGEVCATPGGCRLIHDFRVVGRTPTGSWSGPVKVAENWQANARLFSGGRGILYVIRPDGELLWYRHRDYAIGGAGMDGPISVGTGWQDFAFLASVGDGVLLGLKTDGTYYRYRHVNSSSQTLTTPANWDREVPFRWGDTGTKLMFTPGFFTNLNNTPR